MAELDNRLWAFSKSNTVIRHSNGAKETYTIIKDNNG